LSLRRRAVLRTLLAAPLLGAGAVRAQRTPAAQPLAAPRPLAQIAVGERGELLGVARDGTVLALATGGWRTLGSGVDARAPLAVGGGRVAGRAQAGGLWVVEGGRASVAAGPMLAPHAGFVVLPAGIIAVAAQDEECGRLVRLEPTGAGWRETDRAADPVLPDAQPVQIDFDAPLAAAGGGHIAVLAGPDAQRYTHGVLGDAVEATRVLYLERHALTPIRTLTLQAPYVLEDFAPRPLDWQGRAALLTMRAGPQGAQLAVVAADAQRRDALALLALGPPIGQRNRWLSPATDGRRIAAVHTPHIGGVLHDYRADGGQLAAQRIADGVTAHTIGARELSLALWVGDALAVPTQDRRALRFYGGGTLAAQAALPAAAVATRPLARDGRAGVAALLEDGQLVWVPRP